MEQFYMKYFKLMKLWLWECVCVVEVVLMKLAWATPDWPLATNRHTNSTYMQTQSGPTLHLQTVELSRSPCHAILSWLSSSHPWPALGPYALSSLPCNFSTWDTSFVTTLALVQKSCSPWSGQACARTSFLVPRRDKKCWMMSILLAVSGEKLGTYKVPIPDEGAWC